MLTLPLVSIIFGDLYQGVITGKTQSSLENVSNYNEACQNHVCFHSNTDMNYRRLKNQK